MEARARVKRMSQPRMEPKSEGERMRGMCEKTDVEKGTEICWDPREKRKAVARETGRGEAGKGLKAGR